MNKDTIIGELNVIETQLGEGIGLIESVNKMHAQLAHLSNLFYNNLARIQSLEDYLNQPTEEK